MSEEQQLKEALISKDVDTVIALTGLSYEAATEKCEEASDIHDSIMGCIRAGKDSLFFEEQLSNLAVNLLSRSR